MVGSWIFSFFLIVLLMQNAISQIIPFGNGCGCQQLPVQNLPVPGFQIGNCGCRNNLLANLPNGMQINNNLQLTKSLPCGTNNMQLANLQNLQQLQMTNMNGLQLANGLQMANQDLLPYANAMPGCQSALQLSLQALLSQLSQQPCQCGCQAMAQNVGNGLMNANLNLLGLGGVTKAIGNIPCQPCGNLQVVTGQQEVVLGNNPCPCQSCQNIVNTPCPAQNVINSPCPCQSSQNPMQFTIYQ